MTLGRLAATVAELPLELPATLAFPGDHPVLLTARDADRAIATRLAHALMLRMLAAVPAGRLRFICVDPIGLGQSVASFLQLADHDEALVGARAWTEEAHIASRLAELTEHMENVFQKYLRNQFETIEDYNVQAGEIAEAYRVLVVFDFPTNFTADAARRLVSIMQNGPRSGVYAIVLADPGRPMPHGFELAELTRSAVHVAIHDGRADLKEDRFVRFRLLPDGDPPDELLDRVLGLVGVAARESARVEVPFDRFAPPMSEWWSESAADGLQVPLGMSGARRSQLLALGAATAQHALVVGKTGSGKTTLMHIMITGLALRYGPEELEFYLVDFKEGVEFKPYATWNLPHARVVAIESEREFGLSVLDGLDEELRRRGEAFRAAGVDSLPDYRRRSDDPLPRIVLVVDEFQMFFREDDAIASRASQVLDRLVRQGRAFGVHVVLGSQSLGGASSLARSTIDQIAIRIALQCSESDSRLVLADDNPAARLLSRPGEAIFNAANGMIEGNNRFQTAWLTSEDHERLLAELAALARARAVERIPIVFEGNASADIEQNRALTERLGLPGSERQAVTATVWLGEPIAIRPPPRRRVVAAERPQRTRSWPQRRSRGRTHGRCGPEPPRTLRQPPTTIRRRSRCATSRRRTWRRRTALLTSRSASRERSRSGRRRALADVVVGLAEEVQRRQAGRDARRSAPAPSRYLVVFGLHHARDLEEDDPWAGASDGAPELSPGRAFRTLLGDGPEVGVHCLMWCNTMSGVERVLSRRGLRDVAVRVALQMSTEDSMALLDGPAAANLGPCRAICFDEDAGTQLRFRPFGAA